MGRRLRVRVSDLFRFLRLYGYSARLRQASRLRIATEFQPPLRRHQRRRLLAPLAHDPLHLAARLPLCFARWKPHGIAMGGVPESDVDHDLGWPLARRSMALRRVGFSAW